MPQDEQTVHALIHGMALCRFSNETPSKWPEGHAWVCPEEETRITCAACKEKAKTLPKTRRAK